MKSRTNKTARKDLKEKIEQWCEEQKLALTSESVVLFDKAHPNLGVLDHDTARKDGYYLHLRTQAAALISSWATVEVFRPSGGTIPYLSQMPVVSARTVRVQDGYHLPGYGYVLLDKMNGEQLQSLLKQFKFEAEQKIMRAYIVAKRLEKLPETRRTMCDALTQAESSAWNSVRSLDQVVGETKKKKS